MTAALKFTGVQLKLLRNIDMLNFFERGIKGGISNIVNRYSKANHPDLPDYDPSQPIKNIIYLDMNNLYGCAMVDPLPLGCFRFLSRDEIQELKIETIADDVEFGYALEVDLHYPPHLHDQH